MLPEKDSVLEKPPHFDPNNIILCFYAALYAATYLLPNFMQEMLGYTATTSGMVFSPADLCTMIEVPAKVYELTETTFEHEIDFLSRGSLLQTLQIRSKDVRLH
jgi:hypothetical protein